MTPKPRRLTGLLLPAALVALAVPLGIHLQPGVLDVAARLADGPTHQAPAAADSVPTAPHLIPVPNDDGDAPLPDAAVLAGVLGPLLTLAGPGDIAGVVVDVRSGAELFSLNADEPRVPASNTKLLTAAAALATLGPETRFTTDVLADPQSGTLILRAGGDVLLSPGASDPQAIDGRAGLATLAAATAAALSGTDAPLSGPVRLVLDDSIFTGARVSPAWSPADMASGQQAPVYPLAIHAAAASDTGISRPQDAAMDAARTFSTLLRDALLPGSITLDENIGRAAEPRNGLPLATVTSATVGEQVQHLLRVSDNYLAAALARMTARAAGKPATFAGGMDAVLEAVGRLGIDTSSIRLADSVGLTDRNFVPARQLAALVRLMADGAHPDLQAALPGFPVAGLTGTLDDRFDGDVLQAGRGIVRAKTGTLNQVVALTGHAVDADGRLLAFSLLANGLNGNSDEAKAAVDRAAAALAGCGCR